MATESAALRGETTQQSTCELKGKRSHLHKEPGKMDHRAQNGPYSQPWIQTETQSFETKKGFKGKEIVPKLRCTLNIHSILELINIFCLTNFFHKVFLVM